MNFWPFRRKKKPAPEAPPRQPADLRAVETVGSEKGPTPDESMAGWTAAPSGMVSRSEARPETGGHVDDQPKHLPESPALGEVVASGTDVGHLPDAAAPTVLSAGTSASTGGLIEGLAVAPELRETERFPGQSFSADLDRKPGSPVYHLGATGSGTPNDPHTKPETPPPGQDQQPPSISQGPQVSPENPPQVASLTPNLQNPTTSGPDVPPLIIPPVKEPIPTPNPQVPPPLKEPPLIPPLPGDPPKEPIPTPNPQVPPPLKEPPLIPPLPGDPPKEPIPTPNPQVPPPLKEPPLIPPLPGDPPKEPIPTPNPQVPPPLKEPPLIPPLPGDPPKEPIPTPNPQVLKPPQEPPLKPSGPATVGGEDHGTTQEDVQVDSHSQIHAQGTLTVTDLDPTEAVFVASTQHGTWGSLEIDPNGHWLFSANNAGRPIQALGLGEEVHETFTVKTADGTSHEIAISIQGTNDRPIITGQSAGTITEDAHPDAVGGQLLTSDVDHGDHPKFAPIPSEAGSYGAFQVDEIGKWRYSLDNSAPTTQALSEGQIATERFTVTATDEHGAKTTQQVTITVVGSNDAPVIAGAHTGEVTEDALPTIAGRLTHSDIDAADTFSWGLDNGHGTYGDLRFDAQTGQWTYHLDNSRAVTQGLNVGETVTETFTVRGSDDHGAKVSQTITILVHGTNDIPTIRGSHEGSVVEDRVLTATGTLTAGDVDVGDRPSHWAVASPQGIYGSLTVDEHGQWTYHLDPTLSQSIRAGETKNETFLVRVTDQHGGTATQPVTIHITGDNDGPHIDPRQPALVGDVIEDKPGFTSTSGTIDSGDPDVGDRLVWAVAGSPNGRYGSLGLDNNGHWTYSLDHNKANSLAEGANVTETFQIHVTDPSGERSTAAITVHVHGTNDGPQIGGSASGTVTEDLRPTATGTLSPGDPDRPDTATWNLVGPGSGQYGSLVLDDRGRWTYTLDHSPQVQALSSRDSIQETFHARVVDSHGAEATKEIRITVKGINDAPVISGTHVGSVVEDRILSTSGVLGTSDVDRGDHASFESSRFSGTYGTFAIDANGHWHYDILPGDAHVQALAEGRSVTESFPVISKDTAGGVTREFVTVTITGTNDKPEISGVSTGVAVAGHFETAHGRLVDSDIDEGDKTTWHLDSGQGTFGTLTLNAAGEWTYQLDPNDPQTRALHIGQQAIDTFHARVTDEHGASADRVISVTVVGTTPDDTPANPGGAAANHPPHTGGQNPSTTGSLPPGGMHLPAITVGVTEDVATSQTGALPNIPGGGFTWSVVPLTGVFGELHVDPHGGWHYQLHDGSPQVDALSAGQTVHENFVLTGVDAAGHKISTTFGVEIHGTNDTPEIRGFDTGVVVEDAKSEVGGKLTAADPDYSDQATWQALQTDGHFGTFQVGPNGDWHYALDPTRAQALNAGESAHETFRVRMTDSHGATADHDVTILVQGSGDRPVFPMVSSGPAGVAQPSVSGVLSVSDPDVSDKPSFSLVSPTRGNYGTLSVSPDGHWHYTLDPHRSEFTSLPDGAHAQETFNVQVKDSTGNLADSKITIDVVGTNDAPVIGGTSTGTVTEDATLRSSGQFQLRDPDTGDHVSLIPHTDQGLHGEFTVGADGRWTYVLDNQDPQVQGLGSGKTLTEHFTVGVTDEHGASAAKEVVITIKGTNDVPVVAGDLSGTVTEDGGSGRIDGHLFTTDADLSESTTWRPMQAAGTFGAFTLGADGAWHYALHPQSPAVQALSAGQTVTEHFTVRGSDGHGGDVTQVIDVHVQGTNDQPVITGSHTGDVVENDASHAIVKGTLAAHDPDAADHATWSIGGDGSGHGTYGTLTLDPHQGEWTYALDNQRPATMGLHDGQQETEHFVVQVDDGHGGKVAQDIVVTIHGTGDDAHLSAQAIHPASMPSVDDAHSPGSLAPPPAPEPPAHAVLSDLGVADLIDPSHGFGAGHPASHSDAADYVSMTGALTPNPPPDHAMENPDLAAAHFSNGGGDLFDTPPPHDAPTESHDFGPPSPEHDAGAVSQSDPPPPDEHRPV